MGMGYGFKCKKCDYHFYGNVGVGFLFPKVYKEIINDMKCGKYGKKGIDFFNKYPQGAVNAEFTLARCTQCGELYNVKDLTFYIPKNNKKLNNEHTKWSVSFPFIGEEYVTSSELKNDYIEYEKFNHTCLRCNSKLELICNEKLVTMEDNLKCPKCGDVLELDEVCHWD